MSIYLKYRHPLARCMNRSGKVFISLKVGGRDHVFLSATLRRLRGNIKRVLSATVLAAGLTSHPIVAQQIGPRIEMLGVNVNDEFDGLFARAFGCLSQIGLQQRTDAGIKRPYRCDATSDAFLKLILLKRTEGTSIQKYLESKGGMCSEVAPSMKHCAVEREVTSTFHLGDPTEAQPVRTLFTLKVDFREPDGEIGTYIERYDFGPRKRRG